MIDFDIIRKDGHPTVVFIRMLVEVENNTGTLGKLGFSISTISAFEYRLNGKATNLPANEKEYEPMYYNALGMAINLTRGYLTNYLAPTSYRGYLLPVIDLTGLIEKKAIIKHMPQLPDLLDGVPVPS